MILRVLLAVFASVLVVAVWLYIVVRTLRRERVVERNRAQHYAARAHRMELRAQALRQNGREDAARRFLLRAAQLQFEILDALPDASATTLALRRLEAVRLFLAAGERERAREHWDLLPPSLQRKWPLAREIAVQFAEEDVA
jgi:hypothetical protein